MFFLALKYLKLIVRNSVSKVSVKELWSSYTLHSATMYHVTHTHLYLNVIGNFDLRFWRRKKNENIFLKSSSLVCYWWNTLGTVQITNKHFGWKKQKIFLTEKWKIKLLKQGLKKYILLCFKTVFEQQSCKEMS